MGELFKSKLIAISSPDNSERVLRKSPGDRFQMKPALVDVSHRDAHTAMHSGGVTLAQSFVYDAFVEGHGSGVIVQRVRDPRGLLKRHIPSAPPVHSEEDFYD